MTINVVDDAVAWVRSNPQRFFRSGVPTELELVQSVWLDAILSGSTDVLVHHHHDTWVVAASPNWLHEQHLGPPDLFTRVTPLAAAGPNSMRSEVLLNAFCSEIIAIVAGVTVFVKGVESLKPTLETVLSHRSLDAGVAFRL